MAGYCCPLITGNINHARGLGMNILGCVGNDAHTYGFHVPANRLPSTDYSRVHSGTPADPNQACAGDFGMNTSWARSWLAWLVKSVQAGKFPEIVEVIGSLDGGQPYYWARWDGWKVQKYTGSGHVAWAHVSCDRAKGNATVDLFTGFFIQKAESAPAPRLLRLTAPYMTGSDVQTVQQHLHSLGYKLTVDGVFGPVTAQTVRTFQARVGLSVDGIVGPKTRAKLGI